MAEVDRTYDGAEGAYLYDDVHDLYDYGFSEQPGGDSIYIGGRHSGWVHVGG